MATYYISTTGNDTTGNGSNGSPWRTLYKACTTVTTSGDIIHVNAGTYTETQQCPLSVGVSIEGDGITSIIKSTQTAIWDAIIFAGSNTENTNGNQHISNLKFDGNGATTQVGVVIAGRSNFTINNCTFVDFYRNAVTFSGRTSSFWGAAGAPTTYSTGNSLHDCTITNCSVYVSAEGYGSGCLQFGGQDGFLCYNNTITQLTRGSGGQLIGWPLKMANEGWVKNCKVYNCTLTKEPWTGNVGQDNGWNFVSEFWNYTGFEMYGNTIQGTCDFAHGNSTVTGGEYSIYFHDNIVKQPSINSHYENGLYLEIEHYDVIVENNVFENLSNGFSCTCHDFVGDGSGKQLERIIVRKNLFKNIGGGGGQSYGIRLYNDENTGSIKNWFIENNTFIGSGGHIGIDIPSMGASQIKNINIKNNVINGFTFGVYGGNSGNYNGVYVTYNSFFTNGTNISINGSAPILADIVTGNITSSPNLDASYRPNTGSPLINAGINLGIPYNSTAPDIGYFETGTNSSTIPTISSFTPTSSSEGGSVILTGTNFTDATFVKFGITPVTSFVVNSPTQITATVGKGFTGRVYVTNPAGVATRTGFTFVSGPTPVITSFTPSSATHGQTVTITGTDFTGTNSVTFGLIDATYSVINSTTITATVPIGATGKIRVTNENGIGISATNFTYTVTSGSTQANMLRYSGDLTNAVWSFNSVAATSNQALNDITGLTTMDQLTIQSGTSNYFGQDVSVSPSTTYYFTYDIKNSTLTDYIPNIYDSANFNNILPAVNRIENISSTTKRIQYKFTTRSNSNTINVQPISHTIGTGVVYVDRVQLATDPDYSYIETTSTPITPTLSIYYIAPSGNDTTGTGSSVNPWKTLNKACSTVTTAGSIIYVKAGTYLETVLWTLPVGVNIDGDGPDVSIIQSTLNSTFTPCGILGSAEGTSGNQFIKNIRFDGRLVTHIALLISGRSNVDIFNCKFYDFVDRGVVMRGKTDFSDGPPSIYATGNKFHDNYMYNCAQSDASYGRGCLEVGGQIGIDIYNNTIIQPARASNLSGYCIKNANQGFLKGMKIHDNYLEVPPYPYAVVNTNNHWSFATEFSDLWGMQFYNNRVLGSADQNHQHIGDGYTYSVWYHHNIFGFDTLQPNPVEGIILEYITDTAIIEYNEFRNTAVPLYFTPRPGSYIDNLTFRKNLCYNVGMSVSESYAQGIKLNGFGAWTAKNWNIVSNTFIANTVAPPQYGIDVPPGDNMYIVNNIIRGFTIGDLHIYDGNNNRFLTLKNNNFATNSQNGTPTFSTISDNVNVAPNLNATTYIPNVGSPMIDAGVYSGLPYYGLRSDIGYGEYNPGGNASPTAIVPANRRLIQPATSLTLVGDGYDPDGIVVSYLWSQVSGPSSVTFGTASAATTTANGLNNLGTYVIRLTVTDDLGTTSFSDITITVVAAGSNALPVVNAGIDQTITSPTNTVTLTGSATDSDSLISTYAWSVTAGTATINSPSSATTTVTNLQVGTTTLLLTVTDVDGGQGTDSVSIIVNPPTVTIVTAEAGSDKVITLPTSSTTLSGYGIPPSSGGYNLLLQSETLQTAPWSGNVISTTANQGVDGAGNNTMESINMLASGVAYWGQTLTVSPNTTYYLSFDVRRGTATDVAWGIRDQSNLNDLIASSSYYNLTSPSGVTRVQFAFTTLSNTTSITVHPVYNSLSTGTILIGRIQLARTSSELYHVTTTTAFTAGNTTGTIASVLWSQVSGPSSATIVSATSNTTSVTGLSSVGTYIFQLLVTDNLGATATDTVQVVVSGTPSNISPVANAGTDQTITLPTNSVNLTGSGTDSDGTISSYTWTKVSGPSGDTINSPNTQSTTIVLLATGTYTYKLTVTDDDGATGEDTVQVIVYPAPVTGPTIKRKIQILP